MSEDSDVNPKQDWNTDPEWVEFLESITPTIRAIASKYTSDWALAEDSTQEALLTLLYIYPEDIRGYQDFQDGEKTYEEWQATLTSYCLAVAKNRILVTLHSYSTGNLYVGRTVTETSENEQGEVTKTKRRSPSRYVSLDTLVEDGGAQIDSNGNLSWGTLSELPDLMSEDEE